MCLGERRFVEDDWISSGEFDCKMPKIRISDEQVFLQCFGEPGPVQEILCQETWSGIEPVLAQFCIDAEERNSIFIKAIDLAQDIDHRGRQLDLEFFVNCFREPLERLFIGAGKEWVQPLRSL